MATTCSSCSPCSTVELKDPSHVRRLVTNLLLRACLGGISAPQIDISAELQTVANLRTVSDWP